MPPGPSLQNTVGALLAGAMFSAALSGVLAVQIFLYLRRYPRDHRLYKFMVAWFWIIDTMQTCSIAAAMWTYLIRHYGDPDTTLKIYPSVSVAISCTPLIAACVNILQAVRIYELNHHSLGTLVPHVILSVVRFGFSATIITKLFMAGSLVTFSEHYKPLLHANFALAAVADTYIVCVLCYFLKDSRRDAPIGTKRMLDALVIVTINNGALTSILSIATLMTWLNMQTNTIFLAVHFMTGKCYSNSQMATFNMRRWIHKRSNVGTVVSDPDSSFHMNNRAMAGRLALPGQHRASGSVTLTAAVNQSFSKDECTVSPLSSTTLNETRRHSPLVSSRVMDGSQNLEQV